MKPILFIDRDGTLIKEPPVTYQIDSLELLEFYPRVFRNLYTIATHTGFRLVMVSNQDGLGTDGYPEESFEAVQEKVVQAFANEDIRFEAIHIDRSFPEENSPNRKPRTGMLKKYMNGSADLEHSYVIGDRLTDVELAKNIGCRAILLQTHGDLAEELKQHGLEQYCALITTDWDKISAYLIGGERVGEVTRKTAETDIYVRINLDGTGRCDISTGLGFFDHMLAQIGRHAECDLTVKVNGDLHVDEHHTIEDTALALGEAFTKALGNKRGMERYGFCLPMDDCLCQAAIDFGGRPWLVWKAEFKREKIGEMPTEMFYHFFKSFSDAAKINLNIKAEGTNEHHKIEGIFKAVARAVRAAVRRDVLSNELPSTKGVL
jgi:imidazoleglycerol-phosphate dehydratase/histidinol-phosphatase